MIDRLFLAACVVLAALAAAFPISASAQDAAAEARIPLRIGYVELADDPRYDEDYAYARIQLRALGRPYVAAEVALEESAMIGEVLGVEFVLNRARGESVDELAATVEDWVEAGTHFVVADLPATALLALADAVAELEVILFNATAPQDTLRGAECRANVYHTMSSYQMQTDALVQYLVSKRWTDILVLQGPLEEDRQLVEALQRSVDRFGARITEVRDFELSNDPRQREQSNVALLTEGAGYDVVFVADTDGEFARYIPYATNAPRPVVGSTGLAPETWHWSFERHGAPQLNSRFESAADRRMTGFDWGAWAAVKAVVQSVLRTRSTEFQPLLDYMSSDRMNLDGFKGNAMSFRGWNHQLRQPMLLATANAVIARAPMEGFLHQTNDLDTLGFDSPETLCAF